MPLCILIVLVLSWNNYYRGYADIDGFPVWDERYHIPAAEKYLAGIAHFDAHPPLGKMLIALGEKWVNPNQEIDKSLFWDRAHFREFPNKDFNYSGYRLMPVLFSILTGVLCFLIFFMISDKLYLSLLFSLLYAYENSFIVHSRVATIDSIQVFFMMATVFLFVCFYKKRGHVPIYKYGLLGLFAGLCFSVKLTGLICILLFIPLFFRERSYCLKKFKHLSTGIKKKVIFDFTRKMITGLLSVLIVFLSIYYMHICLGSRNLSTQRFHLPEKYVKIVQDGAQCSLINFPYMFSENIKFIATFQEKTRGLSKNKNENGSNPLIWPLGGKVPVYSQFRDKTKVYNLFPVGNPVVWWTCLLGLFLSVILVFSKFIYSLSLSNRFYFNISAVMLIIYLSYMLVMVSINRVMYLHHYYLPFFLSLIMTFAVFNYLFEKFISQNNLVLNLSLGLLVTQAIICFYFFSPVTYMKEQTRYEFKQRMWMEVWGLQHGK